MTETHVPDFVSAAIRTETVVEFTYPSSFDGRSIVRTFSPWEIHDDGDSVIGFDHGHEGPRRYSFAKMSPNIMISSIEDHYVQPEETE